MKLTVQSGDIVTRVPKPVQVLPYRRARHGLECPGRQRHLKDQSAAICSVHQGAEPGHGKFQQRREVGRVAPSNWSR